MSIPPSIRVNTRIGFPALVYGTGPITVLRQNGIFTINFNIVPFQTQVPPIGNYPTDYLLGYDTVAQQYFKISLTSLLANVLAGQTRTQRSIINSVVTVGPTDQILNLSLNAPQVIALPAAASRLGVPLTFNDAGSQIAANHISLAPNGAETIAGTYTNGSPFIMTNNRQVTTLIPYNDTVNIGWFFG